MSTKIFDDVSLGAPGIITGTPVRSAGGPMLVCPYAGVVDEAYLKVKVSIDGTHYATAIDNNTETGEAIYDALNAFTVLVPSNVIVRIDLEVATSVSNYSADIT